MFYAVIQRPETDTSAITSISRKYDPYFGLVGPHVSLVFPFKADEVDEDEFIEHIRDVAGRTKPFEVRLNELELAWDQWLFLTPSVGKEEITNLHDELYEGPLAKFLREDIEFIPHVGLGLFAQEDSEYDLRDPKAIPLDEEKYQAARAEIEAASLDLQYRAAKLEIISVSEDFKSSETIKVVEFGAKERV